MGMERHFHKTECLFPVLFGMEHLKSVPTF